MDRRSELLAGLLAKIINPIVLAFDGLICLSEGELEQLYDNYSNILDDERRLTKNAEVFMRSIEAYSSVVIHDEKLPVSHVLEMGDNKEVMKQFVRASSLISTKIKDLVLSEHFVWLEKRGIYYFVEVTPRDLGLTGVTANYDNILAAVKKIGGRMCPLETALTLLVEKSNWWCTNKLVFPVTPMFNGEILMIGREGALMTNELLRFPVDAAIIFQVNY